MICPLSSPIYIVDVPVISHLSPFKPFSVKFIRLTNVNENILNVGLKEMLTITDHKLGKRRRQLYLYFER